MFRFDTPDISHVVGTSYRDCVRYAEIVALGPDRPARPHEDVLVRAAGERMNDPELILDAGAELGEGPVWQAPDGRVVATVRFPVSLVTSCAFGGADLSDLYVTSARIELTEVERGEQPTAGGLFLLRPGVRGLPAYPYVEAATP